VISLLAGSAASSTPGLIPEATFLIADAFFRDGNRARTDTAHLLTALQKLEKKEAQIVNMSLAGPWDDLVHQQIVAMSRKGVVFIAAAGNGGPAAPPAYPAAYPEVIAVTAVDDRRRSYDYANRGHYIDVAAPGVRIWTALPENKEGMVSGTSFAAPFVTAIAAVTYNNSRLKTLIGAGRSQLEPKAVILDELAIEPLGSSESQDRNPVYGRGVVRAPRECGPGVASPPVASGEKDPSVAATGRPADIRQTSLR
jgi:subtilisin family serine protease